MRHSAGLHEPFNPPEALHWDALKNRQGIHDLGAVKNHRLTSVAAPLETHTNPMMRGKRKAYCNGYVSSFCMSSATIPCPLAAFVRERLGHNKIQIKIRH